MSMKPEAVIERLARNHRQLVVLAGDRYWALDAALRIYDSTTDHKAWIGDAPPESDVGMSFAQAHRFLGRELGLLVFNGYSGLNVDALGAVSGSVVGGGILVLLMPSLQDWHRFDDPEYQRMLAMPHDISEIGGYFLMRMAAIVQSDANVWVIDQDSATHKDALQALNSLVSSQRKLFHAITTSDQFEVIQAIERVAVGHRRRPLVITSDRGRGKSAALGMAAARLIDRGFGDIDVAAPLFESVQTLFRHAQAGLPGSSMHDRVLESGKGRLVYHEPDFLLRNTTTSRLLLVDEAAGIPLVVLEQLLTRYSRVVFATTVHGYEGTGRSFAIRFHQVLNRVAPKWRQLEMHQPIRWAVNDPVESLLFRILLLDARADDVTVAGNVAVSDTSCTMVTQQQLASDSTLLEQVFGLLMGAHYRTRPQDLRYLMDCPGIEVMIMRLDGGRIIGAMLVVYEGGLPANLARDLYEGTRRPRGHMLPGIIAGHCGLKDAAHLVGARVIRIAVHPGLQGRGLGSELLENMMTHLADRQCDYVGASFGVVAELAGFWQRAGFLPVHLGLVASASAGSQSLTMLLGISEQGIVLSRMAWQRFSRNLPLELAGNYRHLDPATIAEILRISERGNEAGLFLTEGDREDLLRFAAGGRNMESVEAALFRLVLNACRNGELQCPGDLSWHTLVSVCLQRKDIDYTNNSAGLSGRSDLVEYVRAHANRLLDRIINK